MAPPSPKKDIDWASFSPKSNLSLNGHIQARYHASRKEWSTPKLVAGTDITVSGLSPGLNYGQQCYEGLKAFRIVDGRIVVFRPQFHAARMRRSAGSVLLCPPPEELFLECIRRAVVENAEYVPPYGSGSFMYIRPVLFGASTGLWGVCDESILAVFVHPTKPQRGEGAVAAVVCDEFDRCAPRGMGSFKVGGNYAPVWRYVGKAAAMGYGAVLHLDSATHSLVEEFSTSGLLGHRVAEDARHVLVVPESDSAIDSTTSNSLIKIAEREGWIIEKTKLPFSSVGRLDEVISCGTAGAASPIKSVERPSTGEKFTFGPNHERWHLLQLARTLEDIQHGRSEDAEGWLWEVELTSDESRSPEVTSSTGSWSLATISKTLLSSIGLLLSSNKSGLTAIWN